MKKTKFKMKSRLILIVLIILTISISCFTYFRIKDNKEVERQTSYQNIYLQTEDNEDVVDILDIVLEELPEEESVNKEIVENEQGENESQNTEDENIQIQSIEYNISPHIDEITGAKYITYEDFGASSDVNFDNYQCMKEAHDYANENGYEVRATLNTYHIYRLDDTEPIIIKTNTNWNNAQFIIHDENINELTTKNYAIFQIKSNESDVVITDKENLKNIVINKNTKKIEQLSGYGNCLCIIYNENKKQFIRSGSNENGGNPQTDLFKIDNDGNVLSEIQWDFEEITRIVLKPIPNEQITIENGNFQTVLPDKDYEQESGYFNRNIICNRSNTVFNNINHTLDGNNKIGGPYYGFIRISNVTDVQLLNSNLVSHKYREKSSYDLILEYSTNILIENVVSDDIEATDRWGITGTNYTKDITYRNCTLNRIDAHCGVYNLTIDNCNIGVKGFTLTGAGKLTITNSTRIGGTSFIELRSDYGSSWNGDIEIKDSTFKCDQAHALISYRVMYDSDGTLHDYGYDKVLPNLYIDNLEIEESTEDTSLLYIFYNNAYYTGNEQGNLVEAGYTMPESLIVNNYSVNTGKRIKAFYQDFDGTEKVNIQINIPDRPILQMKDESGKEYENGKITNNSISLTLPSVKNISNEIIVNNDIADNTNILLDQTGTYNITVTATDIAGNKAEDKYIVKIDKDAPTIKGVENGQVYYDSITPNIQDNNSIAEVKLYLNGKEINTYVPNSTIADFGQYKLEATDEAGNTTTITFEIVNLNIDDIKQYTIKEDKYIKEIDQNTSVQTFFDNAQISNSFKIYRNNEELDDKDFIKTGDAIVVGNKTYTLIVKGDVNKDGITNIMDLMIIKRAIIQNTTFDSIIKEAADINNDENINIVDVISIVRIIISY